MVILLQNARLGGGDVGRLSWEGNSGRRLRFDSDPSETPFKLLVHEHEIRRVRLVKYLGLMVDDCLTWEAHVEYITGKMNRSIGILKRVRHIVRKDSLMLLYQTMIEPYFRYCNVVWGQCNEGLKDKLQNLQNRAARTIAKLKYYEADHQKLLSDFGWLSVRDLITYDTGVFMYEIVHSLAPGHITDLFVSKKLFIDIALDLLKWKYFHSPSKFKVRPRGHYILGCQDLE